MSKSKSNQSKFSRQKPGGPKKSKPASAAPVKAPAPIAEIEQGPSKFEQFLDRNQRTLIITAVVLTLGVLGYVAWSTIRTGQRHQAGAALVKADDLSALLDVVKQHSGTPAAESARLLAADALWKDGRQDEAITTLKEFLKESPDHAAAPTARASLGSRLMAQGKNEEAKTELLPLLDNPQARFLQPFALICLGDIARAEGNLDEAERYLTRARDEYPDNLFSSEATRHLVLLRAKPPTEVEPPPPPAAPAENAKGTPAIQPPPPTPPAEPDLSTDTPSGAPAPPASGDKVQKPKPGSPPATPEAPAETPVKPGVSGADNTPQAPATASKPQQSGAAKTPSNSSSKNPPKSENPEKTGGSGE